MNTAVPQWLSSHTAIPGLLACGLRQPDGSFICHSNDNNLPAAGVERILGSFEILQASVSAGNVAPRWSTWSFEQGHIRFVARPDGWLLGLLASPGSPAFEQLDSLSHEFLLLQPAG